MQRVLITCMHLVRHFPALKAQYKAFGIEPVMPELRGQQFSAAEMAEHIRGCDTVIAGDDFIDATVIDAGQETGLKAIIKWGIGTDGIDKIHALNVGMPVYNTPGVFGEEVADLAISHLLMLARKTHLMDASVREGGWFKSEGRSLAGMTAGIVGLGSIGRAIARRAGAFGMSVLGHDVQSIPADIQADLGLTQMDLEAVLADSDVLFVACALTPANRHLIGSRAIAQMKKGAFVINVSRGPLVDEAALAAAIVAGKIAGAGLDVFEVEPLPGSSPLRDVADRCTFSTHNGSNTLEAVARINQMTTDIAFQVLGLKKASFEPNRVA